MPKSAVAFPLVCGLVLGLAIGVRARAADAPLQEVSLKVQRRGEDGRVIIRPIALDPAKTAIVVVDMWDRHWCKTYTARVGNLVLRMNRTLEAARKLGIQVVFAPSDTAEFYSGYPQRKAMQAIPAGPMPERIDFNPPGPPSGDYCECGPDQPCKGHRVWTRQHPDLVIAEGDLIGNCNDQRELLNLCREKKIDRLIYMGVASNMCVVYRAFGMLNMRRHGLDAIFVSDLVEAITANGFNPATKQKDPNFTPAEGTAMVQRHLERHLAGSIESRQLIVAAGLDPHAGDERPHVVFVIAEAEYDTKNTLPAFAKKYLEEDFRVSFAHANPNDRNDVPGLDVMPDADLLVLSMRRRALPVVEMDHLERYLRAGKPLVAIRVSCVPFQVTSAPPGHVTWSAFDQEVLGCRYAGYDSRSRSTGCNVRALPEASKHPILKGVEPARFHSPSWLYKMRPLADTVTPLLLARWSEDEEPEPVAWTNTYRGARVFYTSLGHPGDFEIEPFNRLLLNAVRWTLDRPAPND